MARNVADGELMSNKFAAPASLALLNIIILDAMTKKHPRRFTRLLGSFLLLGVEAFSSSAQAADADIGPVYIDTLVVI